MKSTLCIDIGGTSIKAAVLSGNAIAWQREIPTLAQEGAQRLMHRIMELANEVRERYAFSNVGVCSAGQINPVEGTVIHATDNLPGWSGTPIKKMLETCLQVPVVVENDVRAAALGEWKYGAAQGEDLFAMATFGTGIGGAIMLDGSLLRGSGFAAGEWGHIVTHGNGSQCTCGARGCWETVASTRALLEAVYVKTGHRVEGYEMAGLAAKDKNISEVYRNWMHEIEYGLRSIAYVLNLPLIVLGGGIMQTPGLAEKLEEMLHINLMPEHRKIMVKPAKLGNLAGIYGVFHLSKV